MNNDKKEQKDTTASINNVSGPGSNDNIGNTSGMGANDDMSYVVPHDLIKKIRDEANAKNSKTKKLS